MAQEVSPNQNVVGASERRKPGHIKFYPASYAWDYDLDAEEGCGQWIAPSLMNDPAVDWLEREPAGEVRADSGASGPGIEQRYRSDNIASIRGSDGNRGGRAILNEIIDRLVKADLGPDGFLIVCHRGHATA